jgi:activator of HSP90 ATPase
MASVRTIHQTVFLPGTPHAVYTALVDPKVHTEFSGAPATMAARPGGPFRHYGGALEGFVILLRPDERIVEAWRANSWPEGHYSIVDYRLAKAGKGTRVEFSQYGVPAASYRSISSGWREHYWGPLMKFLSPK